MNKEKKELIELLINKEVVKFGKFILSSGKESDYYVNMKMAITDPKILKTIAKIVIRLILISIPIVISPILINSLAYFKIISKLYSATFSKFFFGFL